MDAVTKNSIDPRPKRRKSKDNPYTIYSIGIKSDAPRFYVSFRDGQGIEHTEEISREMFLLFDQFELDDLIGLNEVDRHYERLDLTEEALHLRATSAQTDIEEMIFQKLEYQKLYEAIEKLPEIQRRRLRMYFFEGMTLKEIAAKEGCKYQRIQKSIERAKEKIKKFYSAGGVFPIL